MMSTQSETRLARSSASQPGCRHRLNGILHVRIILYEYCSEATHLGNGALLSSVRKVFYLPLRNIGECQQHEIQVHRGVQHHSILQSLAAEKNPLPKSRREAMQLIQALLQTLHILYLLHRYARHSFPGEHSELQHLCYFGAYG